MEKVTQNVPDIGCTDPDEFVNDPCIEVIEDEATGALDIVMKREIQNTILDIYYNFGYLL